MMTPRILALLLALALVAAACSSSGATSETAPTSLPPPTEFPPAPAVPSGPVDGAVADDLDALFASIATLPDVEAIERLGASDDPRIAWLLADVLRFSPIGGALSVAVGDAWGALTGVEVVPTDQSPWGFTTDHLIAWDLPAPPGYVDWKRQVYELVEPGWAPFFDDTDASIDWRWVGWGGVLIDDRPLDRTDEPCPAGCIPALNDPALVPAAEGGWYDDDGVVFGVVVGDEAVAFPRNIMEVHEMVNITIGGRRLGIPYCTLCGSAQAYLTDEVDETVLPDREAYELRTSGLLSRSNKVMYELHTRSAFDTFTGEAVTGPLREAGVTLPAVTVTTSTWADWKASHPDTRIVAEDGGIGREYPDDPLQGRDDDGPIFPIGDVDDRLGVQEPIVGVIAADGTPVAFAVADAAATLDRGDVVEADSVALTSDGAGFQATDATTGDPLVAHQAFWFAWSQFHPDTELWMG